MITNQSVMYHSVNTGYVPKYRRDGITQFVCSPQCCGCHRRMARGQFRATTHHKITRALSSRQRCDFSIFWYYCSKGVHKKRIPKQNGKKIHFSICAFSSLWKMKFEKLTPQCLQKIEIIGFTMYNFICDKDKS